MGAPFALLALLLSLAACVLTAARASVVTGGDFDGWVARDVGGGTWAQVGTGLNGTVNALADYNGVLIAAGSPRFVIDADGNGAHGAAYLDGDTWVPLGGGVTDTTPYTAFGYALQVADANVNGALQSVLYLAGIFLKAGGVDAKNIAMWDGGAWHALGTGLVGTPYAMATFRRELVVGGDIRQAGGTSVSHIAKWDGVQWTALDDGTDNDIFAVTVYQDRLVAGGFFASASGVPGTACLAFWDGAAWSGASSPLTGECGLFSFAVDGSLLIVGGRFILPGESTATCIATWDGERFRASVAVNQYTYNTIVLALLATGDGMFAAGTFNSTADASVANIIVNSNGTWTQRGTAEARLGDTYAYAFAGFDF